MMTRAFDFVAAVIGLIVLAPLLIMIACAVKRGSPGPILFRQTRIGRGAVPFDILKFRTMHVGAEYAGGQLTIGADPRITSVGAVLRRYKLDELPQLINVVRGDMALVGPRPEVPRYVALYDDVQRVVLEVRPGITDPASLAYRDESDLLGRSGDPEVTYTTIVMPKKLAMNIEYLSRKNLVTDVGVIMMTILRLLRRS